MAMALTIAARAAKAAAAQSLSLSGAGSPAKKVQQQWANVNETGEPTTGVKAIKDQGADGLRSQVESQTSHFKLYQCFR